jgi:hypothetical protein
MSHILRADNHSTFMANPNLCTIHMRWFRHSVLHQWMIRNFVPRITSGSSPSAEIQAYINNGLDHSLRVVCMLIALYKYWAWLCIYVLFTKQAGVIQCYVAFTMKFSEWTLHFLIALCSQNVPDTYGSDSALKKWTSTGLKLQLPMVKICNIYV